MANPPRPIGGIFERVLVACHVWSVSRTVVGVKRDRPSAGPAQRSASTVADPRWVSTADAVLDELPLERFLASTRQTNTSR